MLNALIVSFCVIPSTKNKHNFMKIKKIFILVFLITLFIENTYSQTTNTNSKYKLIDMKKTNEEWKKELTADEYRVLREKATEAPFSGEYNLHFQAGNYTCSGCGTELFSSDGKFDAGCGWPSFVKPVNSDVIETKVDNTLGRTRTEILCRACGGHLGHVFDDGPIETGLRYCVNSLSLDFKKKDEKE